MRDYVVELEADHPGFHDPDYRRRRDEIAALAPPIAEGGEPQLVEYTQTEKRTWATVFDQLTSLYPTHACDDFNAVIGDLGYTGDRIPQLADVSRFLSELTEREPANLSWGDLARQFLTKLSERIFCSTQYIRHHSEPFYTRHRRVFHL